MTGLIGVVFVFSVEFSDFVGLCRTLSDFALLFQFRVFGLNMPSLEHPWVGWVRFALGDLLGSSDLRVFSRFQPRLADFHGLSRT